MADMGRGWSPAPRNSDIIRRKTTDIGVGHVEAQGTGQWRRLLSGHGPVGRIRPVSVIAVARLEIGLLATRGRYLGENEDQ
jgi:hypothetical protein